MSITAGWWIVPAIITAAAIAFAWYEVTRSRIEPGMRVTINAEGINLAIAAVSALGAAVVTLTAWLLWAVL